MKKIKRGKFNQANQIYFNFLANLIIASNINTD